MVPTEPKSERASKWSQENRRERRYNFKKKKDTINLFFDFRKKIALTKRREKKYNKKGKTGCEGGQSARWCFFKQPVSDLSWVDAAPALWDILRTQMEGWATQSWSHLIVSAAPSKEFLNATVERFWSKVGDNPYCWFELSGRKHVVQALKNTEEADWFGWNHAPQPTI